MKEWPGELNDWFLWGSKYSLENLQYSDDTADIFSWRIEYARTKFDISKIKFVKRALPDFCFQQTLLGEENVAVWRYLVKGKCVSVFEFNRLLARFEPEQYWDFFYWKSHIPPALGFLNFLATWEVSFFWQFLIEKNVHVAGWKEAKNTLCLNSFFSKIRNWIWQQKTSAFIHDLYERWVQKALLLTKIRGQRIVCSVFEPCLDVIRFTVRYFDWTMHAIVLSFWNKHN